MIHSVTADQSLPLSEPQLLHLNLQSVSSAPTFRVWLMWGCGHPDRAFLWVKHAVCIGAVWLSCPQDPVTDGAVHPGTAEQDEVTGVRD